MSKFAVSALVYKNTAGEKTRRKAGSVFDDATDADIAAWEAKGHVRDATIGEIAEAVAAGEIDASALPSAPSDEKKASKKQTEKRADLV